MTNALHVTFQPKLVVDVEITEPLPALPTTTADGVEYGSALVLVRLHSEPIDMIEVPVSGFDPATLGKEIAVQCGPALAQRLGQEPDDVPSQGLPTAPSAFLAERAQVLSKAPRITVVLCTLGRRADGLTECLARLAALDYPHFDILVVDNAPGRGAARAIVDELAATSPVPLTYTAEPRPGLSWARNRGTAAATAQILACIDDDEIPDPHWLAEIARGFSGPDPVACVTGSTVPTVVDTAAQDWFEQWGGHVKGRGYRRAVFDLTTLGSQSPLYPLPPFGTGGNVAFRRSALLDVGGFDVALGAGTSGGACEDTDIFARLLIAGHRIVYQPSALVRHTNRETLAELEKQLREYGTGLTAYFTATVLRKPSRAVELVRLLLPGVRDLVSKDSMSRQEMTDFPASLRSIQRRGMLVGPFAYVRSRWQQRQVRRRFERAGV